MAGFLDFLNVHAAGIFVFLGVAFIVTVLGLWAIEKFCWIFRFGRFGSASDQTTSGTSSGSLASVIVRFFVEIIREFRNLLALLIFLLFAGILVYGMSAAMSGLDSGRLESVSKLIQVIVASLGGLVGSIIGYYFGEAAKRSDAPPNVPPPPGTQGSGDSKPDPARKPPGT